MTAPDEPEEQVLPPRDEARGTGRRPATRRRRGSGRPPSSVVTITHRGERREHGRPDELEVVEARPRQAVDRRRQEPERRATGRSPRTSGSRAGRGRCSSTGLLGRTLSARGVGRGLAAGAPAPSPDGPGRAARPAARRRRRRRSRPRRSTASATTTPIAAPATAATSSRRPVMSPTASPTIAAGKMTSMPSRAGSGICAAEHHAGERRQVPRDERHDDRRDPVAARVGPAEPPEVGDRQRERLVGQEVGHHRAARPRDVAQPRRQRRRVQQVAGVEQDRSGARCPATGGRPRRSRPPRTGRPRRTRSSSSPSPRSARSRPPRADSP